MTLFNLVGITGFLMIAFAFIIFNRLVKINEGTRLMESFILLMSQAINEFNRRIIIIFLQFIMITNGIFYILMWVQNKSMGH